MARQGTGRQTVYWEPNDEGERFLFSVTFVSADSGLSLTMDQHSVTARVYYRQG